MLTGAHGTDLTGHPSISPDPDGRLGREWCDDVRRKHPTDAPRRTRRQDAGETDWFSDRFGSGDGD